MSGALRAVIDKHVRRWTQPAPLDATGRFACPRHEGALTLSPGACARLYRRGVDAARGGDAVERVSVGPCMGCPIGATHAAVGPAVGARTPLFRPGQGVSAEPMEVRRRRARAGAAASRDSATTVRKRRSPTP